MVIPALRPTLPGMKRRTWTITIRHPYHNGVGGATYGLAKGVAFSFSDGPAPEIAIVNHGEHSVILAGVWASANPSTNSAATISALLVDNPWDQLNFGSYLNGAYYAQVSYADWITEQLVVGTDL